MHLVIRSIGSSENHSNVKALMGEQRYAQISGTNVTDVISEYLGLLIDDQVLGLSLLLVMSIHDARKY